MSPRKRILVVGAGGREHTVVTALHRSASEPEIFCAPGNAGMEAEATRVPIHADSPSGVDELLRFAQEKGIDLTVVGPEAPLCIGIVDRFEENELRVFGPPKAGALLEGSKCFTKEFLARHRIPSAQFEIFTDASSARAHVEARDVPMVLKADGLAAGKGVIVARERQEALDAVDAILVEKRFGEAGNRLIVEDCLEGQELSLMILTDGTHYIPFETAQDYKPALDGGRGPNTGGMGAYSPYLSLGDTIVQRALERIVRPTLAGLREEGIRFRGILYIGLMLTPKGPQVLEFNVRLGDPETQPILFRLRNDFLEVLEATLTENGLERLVLDWDPRPAVCVVAASAGYPGKYEKGKQISGLDELSRWPEANTGDLKVFHAGTERGPSGDIVTAGGRVLGVTALGSDRQAARELAYRALDSVGFDGIRYRRDIALSAET